METQVQSTAQPSIESTERPVQSMTQTPIQSFSQEPFQSVVQPPTRLNTQVQIQSTDSVEHEPRFKGIISKLIKHRNFGFIKRYAKNFSSKNLSFVMASLTDVTKSLRNRRNLVFSTPIHERYEFFIQTTLGINIYNRLNLIFSLQCRTRKNWTTRKRNLLSQNGNQNIQIHTQNQTRRQMSFSFIIKYDFNFLKQFISKFFS